MRSRLSRYRAYVAIVALSLGVGLAVGVWSWWFIAPTTRVMVAPSESRPATTCITYTPKYITSPVGAQTTCRPGRLDIVQAGDLLGAGVRVWEVEWGPSDEVVMHGTYPLLALRNGALVAVGTYVLLLLIVVPARILRRHA